MRTSSTTFSVLWLQIDAPFPCIVHGRWWSGQAGVMPDGTVLVPTHLAGRNPFAAWWDGVPVHLHSGEAFVSIDWVIGRQTDASLAARFRKAKAQILAMSRVPDSGEYAPLTLENF